MQESFRKLGFTFILILAVFVLILGTVSAHEGRIVGGYELKFGWQVEPALVGQMNGIELTITMAAADETDTGVVNLGEGVPVPEIHLSATQQDDGGWLVDYQVDNFDLSMANMSAENVDGQGHAHILVDGMVYAMVAGDPFEIPSLTPGDHEITLQLSANNHEPLAVNGEIIQKSIMVTVPQMDMSGSSDTSTDTGHQHMDMPNIDTTIVADLQVEVTFGPASTTLTLEPSDETTGLYTASIIPTRAGDYTFRVFGTIGDVEVNETFSSADGSFSSVEPVSDVSFPDELATIVDLQDRIDQLEARIATLESGN